jgi:hypothetical protein
MFRKKGDDPVVVSDVKLFYIRVNGSTVSWRIGPTKGAPSADELVYIPKRHIQRTDMRAEGDSGYVEIPRWVAEDRKLKYK